MNIIIAIESTLVRLDVQDTLDNLGLHRVRSASSAAQALAALTTELCDIMVLGIDTSSETSMRLIEMLAELRIPTLIVASGVAVMEICPRLAYAQSLSVPFDSTSLGNALKDAQESSVRPPGENSPRRTGPAK